MDKKIRDFQNDLVNLINTYELPLEVKRLVIANIYQEVAKATEVAIKAEEETKNAESTQ